MIQDQRQIQIRSSPEAVFDFINKMPNKFPVYSFLETRPFFFLRMLFVDGLRGAVQAIRQEKLDDNAWILNVGDSMGPFTLIESVRPVRYWFALESFFFNCRTGYSIRTEGSMTTVNFDIVAENPRFGEKVWWVLIKPFHGILANEVLRVLKEKIEGEADVEPRNSRADRRNS